MYFSGDLIVNSFDIWLLCCKSGEVSRASNDALQIAALVVWALTGIPNVSQHSFCSHCSRPNTVRACGTVCLSACICRATSRPPCVATMLESVRRLKPRLTGNNEQRHHHRNSSGLTLKNALTSIGKRVASSTRTEVLARILDMGDAVAPSQHQLHHRSTHPSAVLRRQANPDMAFPHFEHCDLHPRGSG